MLWGGIRSEAQQSLVFDFPISGERSQLPGWLAAAPKETGGGSSSRVEFFLLAERGMAELFVTVVFDEMPGAGLKMVWINEGTGAAEVLSEDLSEGISGLNQRTVRVPARLTGVAGRLVVKSGVRVLPVRKMRFDWVEATASYVAAEGDSPVFRDVGGRLHNAMDLSGGRVTSPPDAWVGKTLEAPLQTQAESLDGNLQFVAPLPELPRALILRAEFSGAPLNDPPALWVNGTYMGRFPLQAPDLNDPGFVTAYNGDIKYAGWLAGSLFIPLRLLKEGDNTITIQPSDAGIWVRNATMQIRYPRRMRALPKENPREVAIPPATREARAKSARAGAREIPELPELPLR